MRALDRIRNKYHKEDGKKSYFDFTLLAVVVLLVCFGFVMIYSASAYQANLKFGNSTYFLRKQIMSSAMGFVAMTVLIFIPPIVYKKVPSVAYIILAFFVMALLLIPGIHISSHGATRWVKIGPLPQFEPVELVKLLVILYYAKIITRKQKDTDKWLGLFLPLLPLGALGLFIYIVSRNMSSALIVMLIPVLMISIIAKDTKKILLVWGGLFLLVAVVVGGIVLFDHLDCGAYKTFSPGFTNEAEERELHVKELKIAAEKIREKFPDLKVVCKIMHTNRNVEKVLVLK